MYINFGIPSVLWYSEPQPEETIKCPLCGATARDIQKTGKAGCGKCYEVFADILDPYIKRIHGSAVHTGRVPGGGTPEQKRDKGLESLKRQLKEAVTDEDYLRAAQLRDQIREMEAG